MRPDHRNKKTASLFAFVETEGPGLGPPHTTRANTTERYVELGRVALV
jgi:hypothetical protein